MRNPSLTEIERKILDYMVVYLRTNTYQPSIREIGEEFGIKSTKTVSEHLQALADKGFLERDPSRSRGVRILGMDLSPQTVSIPCYRSFPRTPSERGGDLVEMHLTLDRRLAGTKGSFLVRARGDEVAAIGVEDGDFLLIEPARLEQVEEGRTVAVRLDDGAGYYRVVRGDNGVELHSTSVGRDATPLRSVTAEQVVGRVTALFRRFDDLPASVSVVAH